MRKVKLESQVLTRSQVNNLTKLGFDVEKYSTLCYVENLSKGFTISAIDDLGVDSKRKSMENMDVDAKMKQMKRLGIIPTLSIGDMYNILPAKLTLKGDTHVLLHEYNLVTKKYDAYYFCFETGSFYKHSYGSTRIMSFYRLLVDLIESGKLKVNGRH